MAKATEQAPGTEATTEEQETPTPAKSGNPFIKVGILVVIGMVAVVAAYLVTLNVIKPMLAPSPTSQAEEVVAGEPIEEVEETASDSNQGGGHGEEGVAEAGKSEFYDFESIVVNPAGTAGTRFLSCSVSFQLDDDKTYKAFEGAQVQIKDLLITILSSKTVDELSDIDSRNRMRREILGAVNHMIAPKHAKAVYLVDFVLQ